MAEFDPKRRIVMATFKTVLGHNLPAGHTLTIVEEPAAKGEVDLAMATRLFNSRNAVYFEDAKPTPVETPEQEKARLALEALREAPAGSDDFVPTSDLLVWPEGTEKAGKKVTKDDLLEIADDEGAVVETDDNKSDLIRKIMERRAAVAVENSTESQSLSGLDASGGGTFVGTGGLVPDDADGGGQGDDHGSAGD